MDLPVRLLKQIALYKYLTLSQLQTLNPKWSKKTIGKHIRHLREISLIGTIKYGYHPQYWKLEDVHLLKNKWFIYLKDRHQFQIPDTKIKQSSKVIYQDLTHRTFTIDCQIALSIAFYNANTEIQLYENYFERIKRPDSNRYITSTKLELWNKYVIPDSIFVTKSDNSNSIFCLEMHNGYRVSRIEQKFRLYAKVLQEGIVSKKYTIWVNAYVLNVYQNQSTMNSCLERISKDSYFKYLKNYYLFKTHQNLLDNPIKDRKNTNQKKVSLINLSTWSPN